MPSPEDTPVSIDTRRLWLIGASAAALLLVPVGIAASLAWFEMPWSAGESRSAPEWVTVPQLRATTSDGVVVRARVALDVPGSVTRSQIQRNTQQVGLLLELSVASRSREQLGSPEGLRALSEDMSARLNAYLGVESGDAGVRSVAIQDLLIRPQ